MKNSQGGFMIPLLIAIVVLAAAFAGGYWYVNHINYAVPAVDLSQEATSTQSIKSSPNLITTTASSSINLTKTTVSSSSATGTIQSSNKTSSVGTSLAVNPNIFIIPSPSDTSPSDIRVQSGQSAFLMVDVAENTSGKAIGTAQITPTYLLNLDVTATIYNYGTSNHSVVETVPLTNVSKANSLIVTEGTTPLDKNAYTSGPINGLAPGEYSVVYAIKGKNYEGQNIEQTSGIYDEQFIDVSSGDASILKLDDNGEDTTGTGLTDVINIGFWLQIQKQGVYNVSAEIVFPNGKTVGVATGEFNGIVGAGRYNILLQSNEENGQMTNGVYKVEDVELFETVNNETKWVAGWSGDNGDGTYTTQSYKIQ